ncbi:uncharacterized protein LOC130782228 [Actinidia eriantha]|uniref:uncharacterized protein LOC130782228 n=1 Tax=Actinidia eriantha TaxID=165200 RepID=UPI002587CA47|nr:uncharacterized protein LOC130782228 [Actinidia eriantha]
MEIRVMFFPKKTSRTHQFQFTPLAIFFFIIIFTLCAPATTSIQSPYRQIPYSQFCNDIVPESAPTTKILNTDNFCRFQNAYFAGGGPRFGGDSPKSVSFRSRSVYETETKGVFAVEGSVTFWVLRFGGFSGNLTRRGLRMINYRSPRVPVRRPKLGFRVHGFWSEDSGKLCMVGSGMGSLTSVNVVLKLNYPKFSTLETSLVNGPLESLGKSDSLSRFEPISILGLSMMNYQYKLVDRENVIGSFSAFDKMGNESLGLEFPGTVCSLFQSIGRFELEYMEDCDSVNCNPLGGGGRNLPGFMSFNEIDCTGEGKVRYLLDFSNSSYDGFRSFFSPSTMLVSEGLWNGKNKHLDLVACQIFNITDLVAKPSLADCSIRLSMRLSATLSLRNRSLVVGQMWSSKSMNDSGYFGRLAFQSPSNGKVRVSGLRYEYTEIDNIMKSCTKKTPDKRKRGTYPDGHSLDMRFDMAVQNSKGQVAWGYSSPLSVGGFEFYEPHRYVRPMDSVVQANNTRSTVLNISYIISFRPPSGFKLGSEVSLTKTFEISAEGTYDAKTGVLCMIGCRHIDSHNRRSVKNESLDCEIHISIQFPPLGVSDGSYVKGTIESNRRKTDPLYFERLEFSASSIVTSQAKASIWRMDLEVTMVLISNTLACIFVGLQLSYVKKYPDVLPFISIVMLAVLTLAHMIPLVLNFEAMYLANRNRQNVFLGSGGWLEINEVLVRVITMIAFLLQFRLLQQTWCARVGNGNEEKSNLWISDKKVFFATLPLYIGSGLIAWFVHQLKYSHKSPLLHLRRFGYQQQSFWGDFKSLAGLILDGFLLPQIVFNIFCNSREKALAPSFYVGTTVVRLLPHAYDLYRAHGSTWYFGGIYANPGTDYYSTGWDIVISCSGLLFIVLVYLQQKFGGRCFLPKRYRDSPGYEKVPVVVSNE